MHAWKFDEQAWDNNDTFIISHNLQIDFILKYVFGFSHQKFKHTLIQSNLVNLHRFEY